MKYIIIIASLLFLTNCQETSKLPNEKTQFKQIESPAKGVSGESNLVKATYSPTTVLSWIEKVDSIRVALKISSWKKNNWSTPITIATGDNWFVNWADFPAVSIAESGKIATAHWLQKRTKGTYDYDIMVSQTSGGLDGWGKPFVLHTDGIAAEHGFVSFLPNGGNSTFAVWLDGRNTKTGGHDSHDDHGHGHGGAMTLRTATFDMSGELSNEKELDAKVCDCCQTDAAMTEQGPIVVYRDRSDAEVRDIYYTKKIGKTWTMPQPIHADNWTIEGCPVNGASIAAKDKNVVVAWYTGANDTAKVKVSFSTDEGVNFSETPIILDDNTPLGRIDVVMNTEFAWVTWVQQQGKTAMLKIAKLNLKTQTIESINDMVEMSVSRKSGFPRMVKLEKEIIITWTDIDEEGETAVKTGIWNLN